MRILHIINQLSGRAGAEVSLQEILLGLDRDGRFELGLAVLKPSTSKFEPLAGTGVAVYSPSQDLGIAPAAAYLRRVIAEFRPDLVHTTLAEADTAGRIAAILSRTPAMVSLVSTPYVGDARVGRQVSARKLHAFRFVDRLLSRYATVRFHAITQAAADHAVEELRLAPSDVTVVPRGRDRARLGFPSPERRRAVRRALGVDPTAPLLLNVGRQEPAKGQVYAIDAMPAVWLAHPTATLLVAGREGSSTLALQDAVDRIGRTDRIRFLGLRQDIGDLLSAADLFVFPSLYEGLGGAVLEAMAMGVPVVAARAPAIVEVLAGGSCGHLVDVADAPALASAIMDVIADEPRRRQYAQRALQRFDDCYTLERCVDGMIKMYADVAAQIGTA